MPRASYSIENVNKPVLFGLITVHAMALIAPFYWSWSAFWVCALLVVFTLWFGVSLCYHRLLTHTSFKTSRWFMYVLAAIGALSAQAGPLFWVGTHRLHHRDSDGEGDPHSPKDGFTWAHVLWLVFRRTGGKNPYRQVDDLLSDRGLVWIDRHSWVFQTLLAVSLVLIGYRHGGVHESVAWVLWGVGMRTAVAYHFTWFVNSACHTWGYTNFPGKDNSRNLWWVALISGGEGWHANHHHQPRSASHGITRYEFDPIFWIILGMEKIGLARDVIKPRSWAKT
ncbi:fatty acid desaturase [Patescibacteria group bacterium]|nr:fatty acid desaturase [Patescibacteria group bacterium]